MRLMQNVDYVNLQTAKHQVRANIMGAYIVPPKHHDQQLNQLANSKFAVAVVMLV